MTVTDRLDEFAALEHFISVRLQVDLGTSSGFSIAHLCKNIDHENGTRQSERKLRDTQPNSVLCLRMASYVLQESMGELDHHVDQVVTRERMPSNVKHKRLYQTKSFSVKR